MINNNIVSTGTGTGISIMEYWNPSFQLRFLEKELTHFENGITTIKTVRQLQQLHISNLGNKRWEDIPIEIES
jgi:hypothetical protein